MCRSDFIKWYIKVLHKAFICDFLSRIIKQENLMDQLMITLETGGSRKLCETEKYTNRIVSKTREGIILG